MIQEDVWFFLVYIYYYSISEIGFIKENVSLSGVAP